jgi:hypothetical protein
VRSTGITGKSLLIFRNRVKPRNQKYSAFVLTQINPITPLVSRRMRGVGHRHERAVRCDGRRWRDRRTRRKRTAKSCGSGAAVLALSPREAKLLGGDGGKRAVLRGEHEVSRKAIAQGRPECFQLPCMLVCIFSSANRTRDRGCSKHPVFPAPSISKRAKRRCKARVFHTARSRLHIRSSSSAKADDPVFQRQQ